ATITKTIKINSAKYVFESKTAMSGTVGGISERFEIPANASENSGGFLANLFAKKRVSGRGVHIEDRLSMIGYVGNKMDRKYLEAAKPIDEKVPKVSLAAIGSRYFAMADITEEKSSATPDLHRVF